MVAVNIASVNRGLKISSFSSETLINYKKSKIQKHLYEISAIGNCARITMRWKTSIRGLEL